MLNIIEILMNLAYVYLVHISKWPGAPLIGFTSAVMTLSKTILYFAQEYFCHFCATGQDSLETWIVYWIIPNGYAIITAVKFAQLINDNYSSLTRFWIVFPSLIVIRLGRDLTESLVEASGHFSAKKKN